MSLDELLNELLHLPQPQRAKMAALLLASLDDVGDAESESAWVPELERRSQEITEGRVQAVGWKTVRGELLTELARRRAG